MLTLCVAPPLAAMLVALFLDLVLRVAKAPIQQLRGALTRL